MAALFADSARCDLKRRCDPFFNYLEIIGNGYIESFGSLLKHLFVYTVKGFDDPGNVLMVFQGKLDTDAVKITDGNGYVFHSTLREL
jgi:hypothetical protein